MNRLVEVVLGFLLGILATGISGFFKLRAERNNIIDIFVSEINRNWLDFEIRGAAPEGKLFERKVPGIKGGENLIFTGIPEYEYDIYHKQFFETKGARLAQLLSSKTRKEYWEVYSSLRDTKATRIILKNMPESDRDYTKY